ncbi:FLYWCH zinc finger domain-containing protein [Phthorimaea operculella]|nr:FLYWCH zinc finger domain-containing protein [Phthorimaea operculella]
MPAHQFIYEYKKGQVLFIDGFTYTKIRASGWYCSKRLRGGCKARVRLSKDGAYIIHVFSEHNHEKDSFVVTADGRLTRVICWSAEDASPVKPNVPRDDEVVQKYEELVRDEVATWDVDAPIEEEWGKVKKLLTEVAGTAFGHQKAKNQDWFAENLEHITPLLESKRQAALKHRLNPSEKTHTESRFGYTFVPTGRGASRMLVYKGYTFTQSKMSRNYYCTKKNAKCRARLKLDEAGHIAQIQDYHVHEPPNYIKTNIKLRTPPPTPPMSGHLPGLPSGMQSRMPLLPGNISALPGILPLITSVSSKGISFPDMISSIASMAGFPGRARSGSPTMPPATISSEQTLDSSVIPIPVVQTMTLRNTPWYQCSKKDKGCKARVKFERNGSIKIAGESHIHEPPNYIFTASRKRSFLWKFFIELDQPGGIVKCKLCSRKLNKNMARHLRTKHPNAYKKAHPFSDKNTIGPMRSTSWIKGSWGRKYCTRITGHKYKCNMCDNVLSLSNGLFGNMKRHVKSKHPEVYEQEVGGGKSDEELNQTKFGSIPEAGKFVTEFVEELGKTEYILDDPDPIFPEPDTSFLDEKDPDFEAKIKYLVTKQTTKKRARHFMWNFFKVIQENRLYACLACNRRIQINQSSFANMKRHIMNRHKHQYSVMKKYMKEYGQ